MKTISFNTIKQFTDLVIIIEAKGDCPSDVGCTNCPLNKYCEDLPVDIKDISRTNQTILNQCLTIMKSNKEFEVILKYVDITDRMRIGI